MNEDSGGPPSQSLALRDTFDPSAFARRAVREDIPQTERLLRWVAVAMASGLLVVALASTGTADFIAAIQFTMVGWLAALGATAVGGGLGLLFGFPVAGKVVVVREADPDRTDAGAGDWYGDNNALEQIVDWLTKIIVGLGLVEAQAIAQQFDRIAGALSRAMGVRLGTAGSADTNEFVGGAILLVYLLLGFAGVFLWARRYLKGEYTSERSRRLAAQVAALQEDVARTRQSRLEERIDSERKLIGLSAAAGTQQAAPKDASAVERARVEVERAAADIPQADDHLESTGGSFPAPVTPGRFSDDPWRDQFGGRATVGSVTLGANVRPLQTNSNLFEIDLALHGTDQEGARRLAGRPVRLYLHPTFPDPIRTLNFDDQGEMRLTLIAYGAFTVGAQLDDGTLLELSLDSLASAPPLFRLR